MDGQVNLIGGQGLFNLLGKHSFGTDLGEGDVGDFVAGGVDDLNLRFVPALAQQGGDVVGLPKSKLRPARSNSQARH